MKTNERYTEGSTFSGNLKDTTFSSTSNRPHNFHSCRKPLHKLYNNNQKHAIQQHQGNSQFQGRDKDRR